jgi:hypothetical protein
MTAPAPQSQTPVLAIANEKINYSVDKKKNMTTNKCEQVNSASLDNISAKTIFEFQSYL